jgi:Skp family chaperone for outer membrane proteins
MKNLLIILLLFTTAVHAQRGNNERIKALRTAHITQALDLNSAEAEKFWPIYNKHTAQMEALRKQERREVMMVVNGDMSSVSDADANELIDKILSFKVNQIEHQKALVQELRGIIPPQKILRLQKAEEDFRKILMEQLKQRRGNRKQ